MNQLFRKLSIPVVSAFLLGSTFGIAGADQPMQQQPQSNEQQNNIKTFTGKVTSGGGFVDKDGMKYRLNGAKAAQLRNFENKDVTIKGYPTKFQGHNAIDVESFQQGQLNKAPQNMNQPSSEQNQGQKSPEPGNNGQMQEQNQHPEQNQNH